LLQATVWVKIKIKPVARNVMEGGFSERNVKFQAYVV
jgi:hypothetical protein